MAAALDPRVLDIVDLRRISASDLDPLLERETEEWMRLFGWDFSPSADLVRRYVGLQALAGHALVAGGAVVGYVYFVSEDRKGLLGDLFVSEECRTVENETSLVRAAVEELLRNPSIRRVESQLMMLRSDGRGALPFPEYLRIYPRQFMVLEVALAAGLKPGRAARTAQFDGWSARRQDEAAQVIAAAYAGHLDGDINDQYLSVWGARRFLANIVQYPGCGTFFAPASFVALDAWSGAVCGISLTSMLSAGNGHITQICVEPRLKGQGLGYELMRRSLLAFSEAGCRKVSLTVTNANTEAVRLYERIGFRFARQFHALVWDRG